jgi:beta-mannanase
MGRPRPAKYIAAWRHFHDIFVARGATNAVWAWCPNNTDDGGSGPAMDYYPGDEYVDRVTSRAEGSGGPVALALTNRAEVIRWRGWS